MLDIRTPIGLMFVLIGLLLTVHGLTADPAIYKASLGHNLNLIWGLVMIAVGVALFASERLRFGPYREGDTPGVKWPPPDEESKAD